MTRPCEHDRAYGENTAWPDRVALEHFMNCLDEAQRVEIFTRLRESADKGFRCTMLGHDMALDNMSRHLASVHHHLTPGAVLRPMDVMVQVGPDNVPVAYIWRPEVV